jgi:hypothetical protein
MIRSPHARIHNRNEQDVIVEHLSQDGDWVVLSNDYYGLVLPSGAGEVRISPDAIPELIVQLQGILDYLSPVQNRRGDGSPARIGGRPR